MHFCYKKRFFSISITGGGAVDGVHAAVSGASC